MIKINSVSIFELYIIFFNINNKALKTQNTILLGILFDKIMVN